jgi:uncharacterized membrane protein YkvA (DUF1232 family)
MMASSQTANQGLLNEMIMLIPNFLKMLYRSMGDKRVSKKEKALLGLVIAYVLNPFDFLPDLVPFLGQADDLFLLALVLNNLLSSVDQTILEEHWPGRGRILAFTKKTLGAAVGLIPGGTVSKLRRLSRLK